MPNQKSAGGRSKLPRAPRKIAVLLPEAYGGGTLRGAINIAVQIHDGAKSAGDDVIVEFGYVEGPVKHEPDIFKNLKQRHISCRPMRVKSYPRSSICYPIDAPLNVPFSSRSQDDDPNILVFDDGISNFDDASHRVIISDRLMGGAIPLTSPYSILIFDFLQRYIPDLFDRTNEADTAASWRVITNIAKRYTDATAIFVTTTQAASDAACFGGVPKLKICKLPLSFDPIPINIPFVREISKKDKRGHIIWTTNITPHKNHRVVLEGLEELYGAMPSAPITYVTGVQTTNLDPAAALEPGADVPYVQEMRKLIRRSAILTKNVVFKGELSDPDYVALLSRAELLLHGAIFDNGTFSVAEAAWRGIPSVSSHYAAMDEMSLEFGLPLQFFDSSDPASLASVLREALINRAKLVQTLPTRAELERVSVEALAGEVWSQIKSKIAGNSGLSNASQTHCSP